MWGKIFIIFCLIISNFKISASSNYVEKTGDILQVALPLSAFASTFIYKNNDNGSIQCLKTIGSTFVVTHSLKRIINKERPNGGGLGFPSGHTSSAFSGAAFIDRRYGLKAGVPAYLLACFVGWSRVETEHHDYWDVLAGASLGFISGYFFTTPINHTTLEITSFQKNACIKITILL